MVTDTNICITLSRQLYHSMTSSSFLKTSNRFTLFSLFQQSSSSGGTGDGILSTTLCRMNATLSYVMVSLMQSRSQQGVQIVFMVAIMQVVINSVYYVSSILIYFISGQGTQQEFWSSCGSDMVPFSFDNGWNYLWKCMHYSFLNEQNPNHIFFETYRPADILAIK